MVAMASMWHGNPGKRSTSGESKPGLTLGILGPDPSGNGDPLETEGRSWALSTGGTRAGAPEVQGGRSHRRLQIQGVYEGRGRTKGTPSSKGTGLPSPPGPRAEGLVSYTGD